MAKNEVDVSMPQIQSWDDWFENCNKITPLLKSYEDLMGKYYDIQYSKLPDARQAANQAFASKHDTGFYNQCKLVPGWMKKKCVVRMLPVTGITAFLTVGFCFLFGGKIYIGLDTIADIFNGFAETLHVSGVVIDLIAGLLSGLLIGGAVGWLPAFFHMQKVKRLCKKMEKLETKMQPMVGYLPPVYRNSIASGMFFDLYRNYGVVTFGQAEDTIREYLVTNHSVGSALASMFDVPYQNAGLAGENTMSNQTDRNLYAGGQQEKPNDPNLPDDILTKTFSGVDDADLRLSELIGLTEVKNQVRQMKNRIMFYNGANSDRISGNHMCFLGPPGTGKTTVARIITKILFDFGYIRENKCVEIDGGYLKSPFVGQTTERANAIIRYSMGGVLFIDEAYLLLDGKNSSGSAGSEATGVLLKAMEDHRNDFVVIFAGYEDNVNRLLASNEGFASRIKYKIYFNNFSVEELSQIFYQMLDNCSKTGSYKIEKDAMDLLKSHFAKEREIPGFGNARVVRNALDSILDAHADHYMKKEIAPDQKFFIVKKDVQAYVDVRKKQMQEDGRNFIASKNLDSTVISLAELKGKTKPGSENPDKDLNALVGLESVKDAIEKMKAQFDFYNGKIPTDGCHMCFYGPPGTGKTTVAAIMTAYLYKMGYIRENCYLDINGDFLRGMYLGHTGKRTEAVVQYAQGMVLFIDEAYLLSSQDGGTDSFGAEAIGVLLDSMEKYRKNFVVIFAGYEKEMTDFLDVNSGLRSRISQYFHFTSYTPHELSQMMNRLAKKQKFKVNSDVWVPFQQYLKVKREEPTFGNARFIRQFFEDCKNQHILNFSKGMYGPEKKYVITLQDVKPLVLADVAAMQKEEENGYITE